MTTARPLHVSRNTQVQWTAAHFTRNPGKEAKLAKNCRQPCGRRPSPIFLITPGFLRTRALYGQASIVYPSVATIVGS